MKICYIMYSWERINPETDSTLRLIHECALRKHTVALTTVNNLTIRDTVTSAFCQVLKPKDVSSSITTFYKKAEFKSHKLPLAGFDAIFMRCNPPLDNIAINFLDSVREHTFILNDIDGLRLANNKLYTASFQDHDNKYIPVTHVSKNKEYLERVLRESPSEKMILKPLNGYGGHGVIIIEKSASINFRSLLEFYIGDQSKGGNYVILQEYVEGAHEGDVRILLLNGQPIGAYRRVPAENDIRANISAGGKEVRHTLTKEEKALCKFIGPKLVRDGLYFVGVDVINNKLIEVNVLSPGGIMRINRQNKVKLQKQVIDFIEEEVRRRETYISRRTAFKQAIDDAKNN